MYRHTHTLFNTKSIGKEQFSFFPSFIIKAFVQLQWSLSTAILAFCGIENVVTKKSARLKLLSSNVKSGTDGQLLVSDQNIKHSSHTREQEQLIHLDTVSSTSPTEAENHLTFADLVGNTIAKGTNKKTVYYHYGSRACQCRISCLAQRNCGTEKSGSTKQD